MKVKRPLLASLLICFTLVLVHLPFISADPDYNIAESRDASIDEGLYSCQLRNYIHQQDLTFKQSGSLLKTFLFSAVLFVPYKVFGTKLIVGRLTVLLLSLGILLIIFCYNSFYALFAVISIPVFLISYHVFHYFHFCLAETLCSSMILLSLFILAESALRGKSVRSGFFAATAISMAYFLKIQFIYALLILPISILIYLLLGIGSRKRLARLLLVTSSFILFYLILYYFAWYLPNKDLFHYVLENQTAERFAHMSRLTNRVLYNLDHIFYDDYLKFYTISFYILFVAGSLYTFISGSVRYRLLFISLSIWILIELHKLSMLYLPSRYILSALFAMGLLMTLVLAEFLRSDQKNKFAMILKVFAVLFILFLGGRNTQQYVASLKNRTFNISSVNKYLSQYDFSDKLIMGSWAPSLSWDTEAKTLPIWKDYFNDKNVFRKYHPAMIIAEVDEEDSNQAFSSRNIDLDAHADSIRYFRINRWQLKLLWMKE